MKYITLSTAITLSLLMTTGCKNQQPALEPAQPDTAQSEKITAQEWAKANNAFGLKFLRQTKGNTVFSPYSIERGLGMTLDGASGTTASEMMNALELPNAKQLSMSGFEVEQAMKSVNSDTILEIENTLWPDESITLPKDYLARIQAGYQNKTVKLDYKNDPDKARTTINDAVAQTTHDRIKDLIPEGIIDNLTRLVLTNAVYFKSKWKNQFEEYRTRTENFYNADNITETMIMHQDLGDQTVCIAEDYAIYDLEFDSSLTGDKGAYVMRIVLPTISKDRPMDNRMKYLENVEKQLPADLTSMCKNRQFDIVYVAMPKFKLQPKTLSIKENLQSMGMKKAFSEKAEFPAFPHLRIDDVYHKAFIEIDEKGGEAAASEMAKAMLTVGIGNDFKTEYYHFTVDHPFLYMIIEKSTGAAIFMGRVTDL